MTANELADELETLANAMVNKSNKLWDKKSKNDLFKNINVYCLLEESAFELRQQQTEIEALKKEAALQRLSDFTQEVESFDRTVSHMAGKRELTDEEIESAWFKVFKPESGIGKNITNGVYEFARLIRESE